MEHIAINPATSSQRTVTPYGRTLSFNAVNSELAPIQYMTLVSNILGSSVKADIMTPGLVISQALVNPLAVPIWHLWR